MLETSPDIDGHEGVHTELLEALVRREASRVGEPEDNRDLRAHEGEQLGRSLLRGGLVEALPEGRRLGDLRRRLHLPALDETSGE